MNRGFVYLALATLGWSGNYIAGRYLAGAMPALFLNGVRWAISALILLAIARLTRRRVGLRRHARELVLLGLVGMFLFSSLTYIGLRTVPASQAGLISGTSPMFILLLGVAALRERPGWTAWIGVLLSMAGVAILMGATASPDGAAHGGPSGTASAASAAGDWFSQGPLVLLLASFTWALYTVLGKRWGGRLTPFEVTAGAAVYGAIPSLAFGLWSLRGQTLHMTPMAWVALVYVSTVASVAAYFVWTSGVERVGAGRAAPWMNLLPVWSVVLGVLLLHEHLTVRALIGGAVILAGALLTGVRSGKRPSAAAASERPGM
ncbi:DMT family transporter [Alicyclobacillus macrosporangiidus]|jgi:drug/metabolite transporter (DMT)-like permease|uniref:Threonine/homoserine efflux transporter RhtA n=1 Tax=Alicyclobacillus macrosporangiidus TaxID=392015 RepID=A0A1I7F7T9_9BACL|nr:EamA family transporter [Alicyclobacillus macrosporangiidus]SFU32205.1 Threonine/homoserine efflux transporter RhtA [Alicyclobacillus macrosporangiidus]